MPKSYHYDIKKFSETLTKVRVSLGGKGIWLLQCLLLPNKDDDINEKNFKDIIDSTKKIRPDQIDLAYSIVENLRYIRQSVISHPYAKALLQKHVTEIIEEEARGAAITEATISKHSTDKK
jgi:hypothetical protein